MTRTTKSLLAMYPVCLGLMWFLRPPEWSLESLRHVPPLAWAGAFVVSVLLTTLIAKVSARRA